MIGAALPTAAGPPAPEGSSAVARPPAVEVDGLVKSYGGRTVVDGISFRVAAGETFALLGPNGAGKTTTVEILEGYRRPDGGRVRVLGADPARAARAHRARVGLMLQGGGGVDPRLTAREALALHAAFHARPAATDGLLDLVGLGPVAGTRFRGLSGGERQRLGIALALVGRPELAILDEPTAGLDVEARRATVELLGRLAREGLTILLTSHDLADVERLADRIAIVDRGHLVAVGTPGELASPAGAAIRFRLRESLADGLVAALAAHLRATAGTVTVAVEGRGRYRLDGATPEPAVVAALAAWCAANRAQIVELRAGAASLEERYLELIGAARDAS